MKTPRLILFSSINLLIPPISAAPVSSPHWRILAPLPDPVGYGGMFAGVLGGRLVTGGGSQFRHQPVWLNGEKSYSDRIFTLRTPEEKWQEHSTRLPRKSGHFASAATADAIYLVGGMDAGGALQSCLELRARDGDFVFTRLPDLPVPLCLGVAGIAGGRLIVTTGQHQPKDTAATTETWSLDLGAPQTWRREPDLPGPGVFVAAAASDGRGVFVFGGMAFDANNQHAPSNQAYRFDSTGREWERLPALPEPRVGSATPCPLLAGGRILLIGGYAEVFPGPAREHPGFSAQTLIFDVALRKWSRGPVLPRADVPDRDLPGDPGPGPMLAAPCALWQNLAVVISGEIRASTRTPTVIAWPLAAGLDEDR